VPPVVLDTPPSAELPPLLRPAVLELPALEELPAADVTPPEDFAPPFEDMPPVVAVTSLPLSRGYAHPDVTVPAKTKNSKLEGSFRHEDLRVGMIRNSP
jgi:hypothetical protein